MSKVKSQKSKVKIIFLGTPQFGAIVLEGLIRNDVKPILVITTPDKPVGRKQILTPSPVKIIAQKYDIVIKQPDKIRNLKLEIRDLKPDLGIVAAYGEIIPKEILEIPPYGFINLHPSLLPKYRGPSPIQTAILNGDKETGVTIFLLNEKMDEGPILTNCKFQISNSKITYSQLERELANLGTNLLLETIPRWIKGEIKPKAQDNSFASYTKLLKKEDGKIDWKKTAEELERQIRAFDPWPGSYTFWEIAKDIKKRLKILKARVYQSPNNTTYPIGKVLVVPQNEIGVQCKKDFLVIEKLQLEGKREMFAEEFLRGHPHFMGTILK